MQKRASFIAAGLVLVAVGLYLGGTGGVVAAVIGVYLALYPFIGRRQ